MKYQKFREIATEIMSLEIYKDQIDREKFICAE